LQAQIHNHSRPAQPRRQTANFRFSGALKSGVLPSILFALRHAAPLRPGQS
jgi:hypothetical protein